MRVNLSVKMKSAKQVPFSSLQSLWTEDQAVYLKRRRLFVTANC